MKYNNDRKFKSELTKFLARSCRPSWKYKVLPNGNFELMPDLKKIEQQYFIQELEEPVVQDVNIVNTSKHEAAALQAVALRAFLKPRMFLFERHLHPQVNWKSIRYCWSVLSKTAPVNDFWYPVPGIVSSWEDKLKLVVNCYSKAKLITTHNDVNHIYIKLGLDDTNLWKAQLETLTISFAHAENNLYKLPSACHLLMLYVGKEDYSKLSVINFFKIYLQITNLTKYQWTLELSLTIFNMKFIFTLKKFMRS